MRRRLNGGKGHLIERGLPGETCGLKGFEVGGRADLREPSSPRESLNCLVPQLYV